MITFEVKAQENQSMQWEEIMEQLSEVGEEQDINVNNLIEELSEQAAEPLNLNAATKEQLERFPFLTDIQVENILAYLYIHGQMQTIYELQLIENIGWQTIQYLLPFVCVAPVSVKESVPSPGQIAKYGKSEITTRFDIPLYERKGYKTEYVGPPIYHSLRYGFRYRDQLYAGVTAEKDAGEPFAALHNRKGYDYYSFYLYIRNIRWLKTLALGNYRLSFGQGLVVSNDFKMGKTSSLFTTLSTNNEIKKHSSTDEYNYFRGVATAVKWNNFTLSAFYSHRSLDATVTDHSITAIQKTGLHRTEKEVNKRGAASLQATGGNITYRGSMFKVGITGIYYYFDKPYEPQIREYSKYNIRGNYFHNVGVDYKYRWNHFLLSGETAVGKKGEMATVNSISWSPSFNYKVMFVQRYYSPHYWSFFGCSFSEGGYVQNESGYYLAFESTPIRYWKFFLSADYFRFPWWKYLVDKPSSGVEGVLQTTYSPIKNLSMFVRYRYKQKEKNYTNEDKVKEVRPLYHHRFRYRVHYAPISQISLKFTFDYNTIYPENVSASQGFQLVQSISYASVRLPLKIEVQGNYFHTDDYASRVSAYEKGLLYSFYTPSFYGIGWRLATHLRWDINKYMMVIGKYGQTTYHNREQIGSGNDLIDSNVKQDIQLQLRIEF
ncbi:helix-hairpin-helix domain-containing protein [Bacteroides sp. OttesenSCG-928-M17]|nr:helix-hairpin-helix domain-containing protein [Bacteroides sp. OttesenSCG-928-M17]